LQDHETDHGPFFHWVYSVRQIVALCGIDRETWKWHSANYLRRCEVVDDDTSAANNFASLGDAELVETVIAILCKAIEYSLGYECNSVSVGRDGKEWDKDIFKVSRYKKTHRKIAYAREHAIVYVIGQYRVKIDGELREQLGTAYADWEKIPDDQGILEGVVL
jgi:hypothetical protein